jgi:tetratricopeptide (TPR) repeat protein
MTIQQTMIVIILSGLSVFGLAADFSLAQQTRTDNQIAYYQELLKQNSQNAKAYYGLGDALIRKARETGDASYFNRAEDALKKSLEIAPHNGGVMRHLAYVFYSRHEFEAAAMHARKAVQMNPRDGDAHGVLGDALLEVGEYNEAKAAYERMMELDRSLYSYSRLAGLKSTQGDVAGSVSDLKTASAIGKLTKQPAESTAWVEWQLGSDYFSQGNLAEAESYYQQALKTYPGYYRALAGLAQARAAQQRYAEAVELYQKAIEIIPMPEYIAALGDLYTKAGMLDHARKQYELVEYIGKLSALNQAMYNRELAYFYADRDVKLAEGLTLAERELEYRRDIYAFDVLAWNLYKSGRLEQARTAIEEALRLGTKDAKLFYHAGMIFNQLGDKEKAKDYLRRALSTNPHFHIFFAERASRVLSEIENADASTMASQASEGS